MVPELKPISQSKNQTSSLTIEWKKALTVQPQNAVLLN